MSRLLPSFDRDGASEHGADRTLLAPRSGGLRGQAPRRAWAGVAFLVALIAGSHVSAQVLPPILDPTIRSGEPPAIEKEKPREPGPPGTEILPPPAELPPAERPAAPLVTMTVREINVKGSTVFEPEELAAVVRPYVNRDLTTDDLEELRRALTALYTDAGYINSGAYVPDQDVTDGTLDIYVIEGVLSEVEIEGTEWFFPFYFRQRIEQSAGTPLNINPLRNRLQLMLQDERISQLNSELRPGLKAGEAILNVKVEEARAYHFIAEFNNFQNPTIGEARGLGTAVHQNLLGLGDVFRFTYGRSEGLDNLIDTGYSVPVTPWDTTISGEFRKSEFEVVEDPFDVLDIESTTNNYVVGIRQPLYRTLEDEVAVSVTGEYSENITTLGGERFPLVTGSQNGLAIVAAVRFGQEWVRRSAVDVFALRSRISVGVDAFDATTNDGDGLPSTEFVAWLGQGQYARRFDPWGIQVISRVDLQLSNRALFPQEQYPVGGRFTVRGYRENTLVRDNAFVFSLEGRVPIFRETFGGDFVQLAPFVDVGRGWQAANSDVITQLDATKTLASVGIGLRTILPLGAEYNVYWGQQLNHIPDVGDTLQDSGVHMQLVWQLF